jgi:hypothetical protein
MDSDAKHKGAIEYKKEFQKSKSDSRFCELNWSPWLKEKFNNLIITNRTGNMKSSLEEKWNISESDETYDEERKD